ncbi:MAG: immunoglobulin domain-containing protein [Phycisphaerae bacterium]
MRKLAACLCTSAFALGTALAQLEAPQLGDAGASNFAPTSGSITLRLDGVALEQQGVAAYFPQLEAAFDISADSNFVISDSISAPGLTLNSTGVFPMDLGTDEGTFAGDLRLVSIGDGNFRAVDTLHSGRDLFILTATETQLDAVGRVLLIGGEIRVSPRFAKEIGANVTEDPVGDFAVTANLVVTNALVTGAESTDVASGGIAEDPPIGCQGASGPDVIVGDITGPSNYNSSGGIEALSLGTYSCNQGNFWLNWFSNTNQHPVIGGNLFRYKVTGGVGRFEHVGYSWLKHGFFALSNNLCCTGCQSTDGTHLGVRCADPYTSDRNGSQSPLGPKWQVNAHTGAFTYPPANPSWSGSVARRLQVATTDLEVANGTNESTIRYFGESMYITPDDAAANNQNNNASHRRINVAGSGSAWTFSFNGTTQRQRAGIYAWQDIDPAVTEVEIAIPEVGPKLSRMILAYKVTSLGGGMYDYEYALYNQNSDRSANSFSVPVSPCVTISSNGFHDISYHSGDGPSNVNYNGDDWVFSNSGGAATWQGPARTFTSGNALRWGMLYNFRFVCNAAPVDATVDVGVFKAGDVGDADSVAVRAAIPGGGGAPPVITQQPTAVSICSGQTLNLSVTATGGVSYQWYRNGVAIGGATSANYSVPNATSANAGNYYVVVTGTCGSVQSDTVAVVVGGIEGDANCDGNVDNFDIDAFVLGLTGGQAAWESQYSCGYLCACDINDDGAVNNFDIDAFVQCITGSCP